MAHHDTDRKVAGFVSPGIFFEELGRLTLGEYRHKEGDRPHVVRFSESSPPEQHGHILLAATIERGEGVVCFAGEATNANNESEEVLLFVTSDNHDATVPFDTRGGTIFRHAAIRKHTGFPSLVRRGMTLRKITGYQFEIEVAIYVLTKGDSIRVKPAGAPPSEARIVKYNGDDHFEVSRAAGIDTISMAVADTTEDEVVIAV